MIDRRYEDEDILFEFFPIYNGTVSSDRISVELLRKCIKVVRILQRGIA